MKAYAERRHTDAIAHFESAILSGHAGAHAALSWLLQRVYVDSKHGMPGITEKRMSDHILELAKIGSDMGCRQEVPLPSYSKKIAASALDECHLRT
jgi:hypothetical protein